MGGGVAPSHLCGGGFRAGARRVTLDWLVALVRQESPGSFDPTRMEAAVTVINTRITVAADGAISTATPLAAGEYLARIEVPEPSASQDPTEPFDPDDLPTLDLGPWPEGLSLRREDMYGDDGR